MELRKIPILDVNISVVTNKSVIKYLEDLLNEKKQVRIVTPNPEHIMIAQQNREFNKVLNTADLAIPDGTGVVWAIKKQFQQSSIERVTGADLMLQLCQLASKKNYRVGLLGGEHGVAEAAAQNLRKQMPSLEIVAVPSHTDIRNSNPEEDQAIIQAILDNKLNFLFVAYGAPYQELWIYQLLTSYRSQLNTPFLAMGVGGALDFYAGKRKRAPLWLQKLHLEWLFRLIQEPWRFKRQLTWVQFAWKTLIIPSE